MSDASEHGAEFPLFPRIEVTSGLVVSPGDVLVLAVNGADQSDLDEFKHHLVMHLPGVEVVVVGGEIRMAVMKPATLDVPARPLVVPDGPHEDVVMWSEVREHPGTVVESTGEEFPADGIERTFNVDAAGPTRWGLPDAG